MKIIIPMSGVGQRFIDAGYEDPKPLIEVDGKTIIEHVCNLFPGEDDFIFICNSQHIKETKITEILKSLKPKCEIVEIPNHKKGPVYAVSQAYNFIKNDEEVIVNYCDFSCYWHYNDFLEKIRDNDADGAIPSYRGFHPHMLGSDNYAFMRDCNNWMLEIQEKKPFTDNKMNEYASSGTYYFKNGKILKKYFDKTMENNISLNGEYYVSSVYNFLVQDNLKVLIYEIEHMLQWGTPKDLEEYVYWSNYFKEKNNKKIGAINDCSVLIPMSGKGKRFSEDGFKMPKPLIEVNGNFMFQESRKCLPLSNGESDSYVVLDEHFKNKGIINGRVAVLQDVTDGQACSCEFGIRKCNINMDKSLIIGTCDNGLLYDFDKYMKVHNDSDVVVWTFRNNPTTKINPNMYTYAKVSGDKVLEISMKKPISEDPKSDHALIGTFTFGKAKTFIDGLGILYYKNAKFNGEFYVDAVVKELIEIGMNVKFFEVDYYIGWGTPNDLRTYEYWQSFFHKCDWNSYNIANDKDFNIEKIYEYDNKFKNRI